MHEETVYDALAGAHDDEGHWAFGTGFADPLAGVDTTVPEGVDQGDLDRHLGPGGDGAVAAFARHAHECFSAYAVAASITHALSSRAARRRRMRSALAGPLPLITCLNSSQSIAPNR